MRNARFSTKGLFVSHVVCTYNDSLCVRIYRGSDEIRPNELIASDKYRETLSNLIRRPIIYDESDPDNAYVLVDKKGSSYLMSIIGRVISRYNV